LLENVGEAAFEVAEEEAAGEEGGEGDGGEDEEFAQGGEFAGHEAAAVAADDVGEGVGGDDPAHVLGEVGFVEEDGGDPKPAGHEDEDDLGGIAEIDLETGGEPAHADGKEAQ